MKDGITEDGKWETVSSEYLFRRPWLTVRKDAVRLPDGRINPEFYVLEYPDWVNIIAIDENGRYVMERQFRYGLGKTCYEIAAGVIAAVKNVGLTLPLVVRLEGTNVEIGKKMLADSGIKLTTADSLADAAQKIVKIVAEQK